MPGLFGGIGCAPSLYENLHTRFSKVRSDCDFWSFENGALGGHAFGATSSLFSVGNGSLIGVDGEYSLYRLAEQYAANEAERLFKITSARLELTANCRGNLAFIEPDASVLHLAVEWAGTFPLYYTIVEGGLMFSSHLYPLARTISAPTDEIGIIEFLRQGYTFMGRTPFKNVWRLQPGQALKYDAAAGRLDVYETSCAWVGIEDAWANPSSAAEASWEALRLSLRASLPVDGGSTLMMSGGWDSRTLLAAARAVAPSHGLLCYSHGDTRSRELRLVEHMCQSEGVQCRLEPIEDRVWDLDSLRRGFEIVENVVFPHWHRAGALLHASGVRCVLAGVYGEVLGGHYGRAMVERGRKRVTSLAMAVLGFQRNRRNEDTQQVKDLLRVKRMAPHWYLSRDFENSIPDCLAKVNADIEGAVDRLASRGIVSGDQLIEAFVGEHRGTQFINAQILSCRGYVDVALPFTDREFLYTTSRIPINTKIHNSLNREMLRRFAPSLLRFPLAATLVPASAPIALQEASRLVRKIAEEAQWKLHFGTRTRIGPPRQGWVNFEFLRQGDALNSLVSDLRSQIWNREALQRYVSEIQSLERKSQLYPIFDQLSKIYTIDLLLR